MGFLIRNARPGDLDDLFRLAKHLDSYNLPADKARLKKLLADTQASFAGRAPSRAREKYLFVLERKRRVIGSSLVIAQHGTPGFPHLYMDVFEEPRHSYTLNKTVTHRCLRLGWTEAGPTELGGLVLLPQYRGRPEKLGTWLSYTRFLFLAARRRRFRPRLLVEFLPAFLRDGVSPFWEYFGRKFTGLTYKEADRLSIDNKEFIIALFPHDTVYQDFFPKDVIGFLGRVGKEVEPAARLLEKLGFRYASQVEPFDGGPYFTADTDRVTLVRRAKKGAWREAARFPSRRALLLLDRGAEVRALAAPALWEGKWSVEAAAAAPLDLRAEDAVWGVPLEP